MEIEEVLRQAQDAIAVGRVFGAPYEKNGVTVIPAATLRGGLGGGRGDQGEKGKGAGGGLGLTARPAGAYVIRGDSVVWQPAMDANRIVLAAGLLGGALLIAFGSFAQSLAGRRRRRRGLLGARW